MWKLSKLDTGVRMFFWHSVSFERLSAGLYYCESCFLQMPHNHVTVLRFYGHRKGCTKTQKKCIYMCWIGWFVQWCRQKTWLPPEKLSTSKKKKMKSDEVKQWRCGNLVMAACSQTDFSLYTSACKESKDDLWASRPQVLTALLMTCGADYLWLSAAAHFK